MASVEIITERIRFTPKTETLELGNEPVKLLEDVPSITANREWVQIARNRREERLVITFLWEEVMILHKGIFAESKKGEGEKNRKIEIAPGDKPKEFYVRPFGNSMTPEFIIRILPKEKHPQPT